MREDQVLYRIDKYFQNRNMSLEDKLFYAKLIATLDLESGHYNAETEKRRLELFSAHVDRLREKLRNQAV
ncbi:hypothetical protein GTO91_03285 [Heliobacterium undosum]|uniref:Uncharacterized protein n=1 Tax=Heliomicrobium undosum TaxID=121734 RepID=A0A845KYS2_9FIRM|nr:hypothetical protein [Heliomicrobium undosum]MZP28733.1 hypothetical protein [Heliomicrobium undosum]